MEQEVVDDKTLNAELDESIRATLHEIQSRQAAEPEPEEPAAAPEEQAAAAPEKARDDKTGQFVKGEQKRHKPQTTSAAQAEPPTKNATTPVAEPAAAEPAEPELRFGKVAVDLARPPSSWKPAAKAAWNALPEDVRKEIYRRETDFSNSVLNGPLKESADFGKAVRTVVEPYRGLIEAEGGDYTRAIADTMKTAALFRTGSPQAKLQALFQIDQQFCQGALNQHFLRRVEEEVARRSGGAAPAAAAAALVNDPRIDAMRQQFETIQGALQQQERERQAQAEAASNAAVEEFLAAKDEKGGALYPFVDNVLEDMSARVSALRRANPSMAHQDALKRAYEEAVWANPETRAVLIAQQTAAAAAPAQALRKVEAAKAASAGTLPKRGALPAASPVLSMDETIRETGRKLGMF